MIWYCHIYGNEQAGILAVGCGAQNLSRDQQSCLFLGKSSVNILWQSQWTNQQLSTVKSTLGHWTTSSRPSRLSRLRVDSTLLTHLRPFINGTFPPQCVAAPGSREDDFSLLLSSFSSLLFSFAAITKGFAYPSSWLWVTRTSFCTMILLMDIRLMENVFWHRPKKRFGGWKNWAARAELFHHRTSQYLLALLGVMLSLEAVPVLVYLRPYAGSHLGVPPASLFTCSFLCIHPTCYICPQQCKVSKYMYFFVSICLMLLFM